MATPPRFQSDDLSVVVSELLVATADRSDPLVDGTVSEVLRMLRERLQLDVIFVSEFTGGQRVFRFVDSVPGAPALRPGDGNPVEESFCQLIVDGRLPQLVTDVATFPGGENRPPVPFRVGAHLSTPIVLPDGRAYGTLCCFSTAPRPDLRDKDLQLLQQCARLVARKLDAAARRAASGAPRDDQPTTVWQTL